MATSYRKEIALQRKTINQLNQALAEQQDLENSLDVDASEDSGRAQAPPRPVPLPDAGVSQRRFNLD